MIESIQNEVKQRRRSTKYETAATQLWDAARGKGRAIYTHMRSSSQSKEAVLRRLNKGDQPPSKRKEKAS